MPEALRKTLYGALFTLFGFATVCPVAMFCAKIASPYSDDYTMGIVWVFFASVLFSVLLAQLFGGKRVWLQLLLLFGSTVAFCFLFAGSLGPLCVLYAFPAGGLASTCHVASRNSSIYRTAPFFPFIGIVLYGVLLLITLLASDYRFMLNDMTIPAVVYLVLTAYFLSAQGISQAALSRKDQAEKDGAPAPLRRGVFGMTTAMILLVALVACLKPLWNWLHAGIKGLLNSFLRFLNWVDGLFEHFDAETTSGLVQPDVGESTTAAAAETSLFWQIMSKIGEVIGTILAVALVLILFYVAFRKLYKLLREWIRRYLSWFRDDAADFTDEQENLLDWGDVRKSARDRYRRFMDRFARKEQWSDQTDERSRIRFLYRQLLRKKRDASLQKLTPNQLAASDPLPDHRTEVRRLADAYNRARYSEQPLKEGEAESLRDVFAR